MSEHAFWITSRAAGIIALLVSSLAVAVGLSRRGKDWRIVHESLSLATMVALAVHALSLLGDSYLRPSLADLTIPFVSGYERLWMSVGIVAGWAFVILGLSYYVRARIGIQRWRVLHRFTALAWVLGIAHALMMGTDAGTAWFLLAAGLFVVPAGALLVRRFTPTTPVPA
ncbi:ferric reductase-like transmembrane domain-containing protein [Solirubrobacter soli]|uniref:ferric reductase-like transmembrane domain-containing protein n=1 Tax=Solirubrobacter soli TaxID=363832 RepID=UPI0004166D53|nr:ferric reductase-like transmembrane domain-containing protein [Solirubrobacter soli]